MPNNSVYRTLLLDAYADALDAVEGAKAVQTALTEDILQKAEKVDWHLLCVGKAAVDMAQGAVLVLGMRLIDGLIVSKTGHFEGAVFDRRFICLEAEHPIPAEGSLRAGKAVVEFCDSLPRGDHLLVCISGGASSLLEVLPKGLSLKQWQVLTQRLLAGAYSIEQINGLRSALSAIKAGGLAKHLEGCLVTALYISDVPGNHLATVGSGLLMPPKQPPSIENLQADYSQDIQAVLEKVEFPPNVPPCVGAKITHRIVATSEKACEAARDLLASSQALPVTLHAGFLQGFAELEAKKCVGILKNAPPGWHIWGAETVVSLPQNPGRGGRNQHFALAAAMAIQNEQGFLLLAAGTDGTDGETSDTGALVDGFSIARGEAKGLASEPCLEAADSGSFLQASGDLLHTGPTGTNVMDMVIGIKMPPTF